MSDVTSPPLIYISNLHIISASLHDRQLLTNGCHLIEIDGRNRHSFFFIHMVVNPWGTVLSHMDEKEGMAVTTIDLDEVASIREQLPIMKTRRDDM